MRILYLIYFLHISLAVTGQQYTRDVRLPIKNRGNVEYVGGIVKAGPAVQVTGMSFSPDSRFLAVGAYREVLLWDLHIPKLVKRINAEKITGHVRAVAFLSDNQLALGCGNPGESGEVHIVDINTSQIVRTFSRHEDAITCLVSGHNGNILAAGDATGKVTVINLAEDVEILNLKGNGSEITGICFSSSSNKLAFGNSSGQINVYDTENKKHFAKYNEPGSIKGLQFVQSGTKLTYVLESNEFNGLKIEPVFNNLGLKKRKNSKSARNNAITINGSSPLGLITSRKGNIIYIPCKDGSIRSISWYKKQEVKSVQAHNDWITASILSGNEQIIATGDAQGVIKLWDVNAHRLMVTLLHIESGTKKWLAMSPAGYFTGSKPDLIAWEKPDGSEPEKDRLLYSPKAVAVSMRIMPKQNYKNRKKQFNPVRTKGNTY